MYLQIQRQIHKSLTCWPVNWASSAYFCFTFDMAKIVLPASKRLWLKPFIYWVCNFSGRVWDTFYWIWIWNLYRLSLFLTWNSTVFTFSKPRFDDISASQVISFLNEKDLQSLCNGRQINRLKNKDTENCLLLGHFCLVGLVLAFITCW